MDTHLEPEYDLACHLLALIQNHTIDTTCTVSCTFEGIQVSQKHGGGFTPLPFALEHVRRLANADSGIRYSGITCVINIKKLTLYVNRTIRCFYSWQSWTASVCNKTFIADALQHTSDQLQSTHGCHLLVDSDVRGLGGSIGFADAILQKISHAHIFIADITPVGHNGERLIPNANVMFELGYAVATLGWNHVIMIQNTAFGDLRAVPTDLSHRFIECTYCLGADANEVTLQQQRYMLQNKLITQIQHILEL